MANPYGPYTTDNTLGANVELTYLPEATYPYRAGPPFALGQILLGTDDTAWVFARSNIVVGANVVVGLDANFNIIAGTGYTTPVAFAIGDFGWVRKTAVAF